MASELYKDIWVENIGSTPELLTVHLIKSPGTNPPLTNHYDLQFVSCGWNLCLPGVSLGSVRTIGKVITELVKEMEVPDGD